MARYRERRQNRYDHLRGIFQTFEAEQLSKLPNLTPALRACVRSREAYRARFEKIASRKLASGDWQWGEVKDKWITSLKRLYKRKGWLVKFGAVGNQPRMRRGSPNAWAMYREFEDKTGGHRRQGGLVSPWELKQVKKGKTPLDRGQIFIQKSQRGKVNKGAIMNWLSHLDANIRQAKGARRTQLIQQRMRLGALV